MQTYWHAVVAVFGMVSVVGCLVLFGLFFEYARWLHGRAKEPQTILTVGTGGPVFSSGEQTYTFIAQPVLDAALKKEPAAEESKPQIDELTPVPKPRAYCGHCGYGIYSDPIESIDLAGTSYISFACNGPNGCEKKTLVIQ